MLFADAFAVVGLYFMFQTVAFLAALVWMMLIWFWNRVILGIKPVDVLRHEKIVNQARRTRLTREEKTRRIRALYPIQYVERQRWPVSYRPAKH